MDSHKFIQALQDIGYPSAHKLNPQDLSWLFENPATVPFMNWFSNSVGVDNYVSTEERKEFQDIEKYGSVIEGHQLEEALKNVNQEDAEPETVELEVERLKKSLLSARAKKQALVCQCKKLSVEQVALNNRVMRMKLVGEQAYRMLKKATDKCAVQDAKINKALQDLSTSVAKLAELYKRDPEGKRAPADRYFLSHIDLSAYQETEANYSKALTAFTKKQFFEGVARMSGEGEASHCSLLDLNSIPEDVAAEDKQEAFVDNCEKLQRLRSTFAKSDSARINALINAKKAHSAVSEATALLQSLKSGQFPSSTKEISILLKGINKHIEEAQKEAQPLLASLPDLIKELSSLQGGEILTGDYNLKLKRQGYFTKKQDQIINYLIEQRARSEFVSLLYDLELRCHKETHVLLSALGQVLNSQVSAWKHSLRDLNNPDLCEKKFQSNVVDARDTSMLRLFSLFGDSESDKDLLCVHKQKIVEKAKHVHAQHTCAKAADQTTEEKHINKVNQLENCVRECEDHLYAGSSTISGQPMLSAMEIQENIATLTANLAVLKRDLQEVVLDVNKKKEMLKKNPLLCEERELFTLFHTDGDRLRHIVEELTSRTTAQSIE